ncbi:hypothetical protein C8J56DRAFT_1056496 [Mycena floridula]|nr:hypothetical protein C8J56DRAFT_1056496 [Mycena floridula]
MADDSENEVLQALQVINRYRARGRNENLDTMGAENAPAITPYNSTSRAPAGQRSLNTTIASIGTLANSTVHPFRGVQNLGFSLGLAASSTAQASTSSADQDINVNRDRLISAQRTLPRAPDVAVRTSRRRPGPRGRAQHPPGLQDLVPQPASRKLKDKINETLYMEGDSMRLRLQVNIWPARAKDSIESPVDSLDTKDEIVFHVKTGAGVARWRDAMGMRHRFVINPQEMTLHELYGALATAMSSHAFRYEFPSGPRIDSSSVLRYLPDYNQPFQILGFVNAGGPNRAGLHRLSVSPFSSSTTIYELMAEKSFIPPLAFSERHFIINIRLKRPIQATLSLSAVGLGADSIVRKHRCIGDRFYAPYRFRFDEEIRMTFQPADEPDDSDCEGAPTSTNAATTATSNRDSESRWGSPGSSAWGSRCWGNPTVARAISEERQINTTPQPQPERAQSSSPISFSPLPSSSPMTPTPSTSVVGRTLRPLPRVRRARASGGVPVAPFNDSIQNPIGIWEVPYSELTPSSNLDALTVQNFTAEIFGAASAGAANRRLQVRSSTVRGLATSLQNLVLEAANRQDFTSILTPSRSFTVEDETISPGQGVEDEAISTLFNMYRRSPLQSRVMKLLFNNQASICFSLPLRYAADVSPLRLTEMQVFGAICALMLIYGKFPEPLGPLFLKFVMSELNIHSLTEGFVREWAPDLARDLRHLIDAGPTGDISSLNYLFESYCESTASAHYHRNARSHSRLASEVLYSTIIGSQSVTHPELQAFLEGFRLPCRNGFEFTTIIRNRFPGGVQSFLSLCSMSQVTGLDTIKDHLLFETPSVAFEQALGLELNITPFRFSQFVTEFLSGSGIPDNVMWSEAIDLFTEGLPLELIDEPFFRSRMFTWAVTGSPELKAEILHSEPPHKISVILCLPDHSQYGDPSIPFVGRVAFAQRGQLCMHTCINTVLIPAAHFSRIAQRIADAGPYPNEEIRAQETKKALHHWILVELLNAIGKHSIT